MSFFNVNNWPYKSRLVTHAPGVVKRGFLFSTRCGLDNAHMGFPPLFAGDNLGDELDNPHTVVHIESTPVNCPSCLMLAEQDKQP